MSFSHSITHASSISTKNLLKDYQQVEDQKPTERSQYTVSVRRKGNSLFFFKEISENSSGDLEGDICSENFMSWLIKLIIPREPGTDTVFKDIEDAFPCGLLVEAIEGFRSFGSFYEVQLLFLLLFGRITGVGEITAIWLLMAETDGKMHGNIGVNGRNETVKLDNGETRLAKDFSTNERFPISDSDIDNLPLPPSFVKERGSTWFKKSLDPLFLAILWLLSCKKSIRTEVNSTLLKFILLPPELLRYSIECLIKNKFDQTRHFTQITKRIERTREFALKSKSFRNYMLDDKSQMDLKNALRHLQTVKLPGDLTTAQVSPSLREKAQLEYQSLQRESKRLMSSYSLSFKIGYPIMILLIGCFIFYLGQAINDRTHRLSR